MEYEVFKEEAGLKLSAFLKLKLKEPHSLRQIKRWLESNLCCVNGQVERFASKRLKAGDSVRFQIKEVLAKLVEGGFSSSFVPRKGRSSNQTEDSLRERARSEAEKCRKNISNSFANTSKETETAPIEILYEDNHFKVINKPAGVASEELQELLVHRLDKETTGVMVLPKTKEAYDSLKFQFKERTVYKRYLALVDGIPKEQQGIITSKIAKKRENFWGEDPRGKMAITEWKLDQTGENCSLVSCYPKTGRTHQIRLHMHQMGHPVLGDYHYCRQFNCAKRPQRQLLHASELRFFHPFNEDHLAISAPLPKDFKL